MNDKVMDVTAFNNGDNFPTAIVEKAKAIVAYYQEHDEHPQAESLVPPNRVKIDEGFYASVRPGNEEEQCRPGVVIWADAEKGCLPCAAVSDLTVIINGPTVTPEQVDFLMTKFKVLLDTSFFKG